MEIVKILAENNTQDIELFQKLLAIYQTEKDNLYRNKLKNILSLDFELALLGPTLADLKNLRDKKKHLLKLQAAKNNNNLHVFITVNCKPGVSLAELIKKTEKLCHRQCFVEPAYWVFEQRSGCLQDAGKGKHCHILLTRKVEVSTFHIRRNIQNTMKNLVGQVKTNVQLNIQFIGEEFYLDKKEYILGTKTGIAANGQLKSEKQSIDKIWRLQNNLDSYYSIPFEVKDILADTK